MSVPPIARHMIVCDTIVPGAGGLPRLGSPGVAHVIVAPRTAGFPYSHPELCVYLRLSGGARSGRCRIVVAEANTGRAVFSTPEHDIGYPADRHAEHAVVFRIRECVFPNPGLYWVQFQHDQMTVQREPLIVR